MADTAAPEASTPATPVEATAPSKEDAEEAQKWADIKAEARARGVERGHRKEDKPEKPEPKEAKPKAEKETKAKPDDKPTPTAGRDEKGRFAPATPDKAAAKAEPAEKTPAKPAAETKPPPTVEEPKPPEPKRPQRTDAEINASFARLKREKRELEADRAEVTRARSEHENWRREQSLDKELREKDPYGWLEKHGFDLVDVARETKRRSEMTPAERETNDLGKTIKALQAEIAELKKSPPAAVKQPELHELPEAQPWIDKAATAHSVLSPSDYPLLSQESSREVGLAALEMDHQHWRRTGKHLDLRSIFRILEQNLNQHGPTAPSEERDKPEPSGRESENGGPTDTGNRPPAVNHSLSARTTAKQKPERGSREAAINRLDQLLRN